MVEYMKYDKVLVSSHIYARQLATHGINAHVVLQGTDFVGNIINNVKDDITFVGNSRGVFRQVVEGGINSGLPFTVYGKNWTTFGIKDNFVDNGDLINIYRQSKTINRSYTL